MTWSGKKDNLKLLGSSGRADYWVLNFWFDRKIQVRVDTEYSKMYTVENGTLQGDVCSPLLFKTMIDDNIFSQAEPNIGKSLYADDGALWGHNVQYVNNKLQAAVDKMEIWANEWGFTLPIVKSQIVCFSRRHKIYLFFFFTVITHCHFSCLAAVHMHPICVLYC